MVNPTHAPKMVQSNIGQLSMNEKKNRFQFRPGLGKLLKKKRKYGLTNMRQSTSGIQPGPVGTKRSLSTACATIAVHVAKF